MTEAPYIVYNNYIKILFKSECSHCQIFVHAYGAWKVFCSDLTLTDLHALMPTFCAAGVHIVTGAVC
jgi:hypothetical protein